MSNWQILSDTQSSNAWEYIYGTMKFNPRGEGKLIEIPQPSESHNISRYYAGFREDYYSDLHEKIRQTLCVITREGESVLALNWQHDCYLFNPRLAFEKDEFDEWLIPVFPNGDYIFFLTPDFENGIFCDGVNLSISLFGKDMIEAIKTYRPLMFI